MSRFLIVIPDGVGIRNFLCTGFIDFLLEQGDVAVWHALPPAAIARFVERFGKRVEWHDMPPAGETPRAQLYRTAKLLAQLYRLRREDWNEMTLRMAAGWGGSWKRRLLRRAAILLGRLNASERGVARLHEKHARIVQRSAAMTPFRAALDKLKPDVVFCTHQRASRAVPAMLAARERGVPTATFVYSWDNLPKGRMAVHADHYLVWSDHMRAEMARYYPDVPADRVHICGTPQFEYYRGAAAESGPPRDEFLRSVGMDPSRPAICYSGDDVTTSPDDEIYLDALAKAVSRIESRPQILFRRCPVDDGTRYAEVLARWGDTIVDVPPLWNADLGNEWTSVLPTCEDFALLSSVVRHCDLVVNVASTMALDFAVLDKPAIYINWNPPRIKRTGRVVPKDLYRLPHFRPVHELQPLHWASSVDDLERLVRHALAHPEDKREARKAWLDRIVQPPLELGSRRLADALIRLGVHHLRG